MIRRVVEYVVTCDSGDCYESTAYGSTTAADCAESAQKDGWTEKYPLNRKAKNKHWLCPYCSKQAKEREQ